MKKYFIVVLFAFLIMLPSFAMADSEKMLNSDNGHYYQRIDTSMTWTGAKSYCENLGGHLATITSKEENDFIYNNLIKTNENDCFLGGTDIDHSGEWKWITGETWEYENWKSGEPNYFGIEHYLQFHGGNTYYWNNITNNLTTCSICEWDSSNQCSQSDLDSKYNEGYSSGFEAGKKYCQNNPSACGIDTGICSGSGTSSDDNCATYDFFNSVLSIPCLKLTNKSYWLQLKNFQVIKYGENN